MIEKLVHGITYAFHLNHTLLIHLHIRLDSEWLHKQ